MKGDAEINFDNADSTLIGNIFEIVGTLKPGLADQSISLKILKPDSSVTTLSYIKTGGQGVFRQKVELNLAGNWNLTATWAGNESYESVTKTLNVNVSAEVGKTIIVLGGGNADVNPEWKTF